MSIRCIPRGVIYHSLWQDLKWLCLSLFSRLDDMDDVRRYEHRFAEELDIGHCVAFPYARTALYFSLKSLNLPKGSEILMPPLTIKAILDVTLELGLKPVFVDIDPDTFCFDYDGLKGSITQKTKVALITYLFGIVPDVEAMTGLLRENDIFVIEDFSQCLYGEFHERYTGTFGDVGIYSASSIKTLDTYGGGMAVCHDEETYNFLVKMQAKLEKPSRSGLVKRIWTDALRNLATTRTFFHFVTMPVLRVINKLKPGSIVKHTGSRSTEMIDRLPREWFTAFTSFQARVGMVLIEKVKRENQIRVKNVQRIIDAVPSLKFPSSQDNGKNVYWQLAVYADDPTLFQSYLNEMSIDTSTTSLVLISKMKSYPYLGNTPNAEKLYKNGMFIPSYPYLQDKDIDHIGNVLNQLEAIAIKGAD